MHTGKKTKIIATIGPASESEDVIKRLILEGVNIFRFNTKHNSNEWHANTIKKVRKVANLLHVSVGILVDLQGPEIRIDTKEGQSFELVQGEEMQLVYNFDDATMEKCIRVPDLVVKTLDKDDKFSIDDGFMEFDVVDSTDSYVIARITEDAVIKPRKGLNLAGKDIPLPSLTDADRERITMAKETDADFIALSFVRTKEDIESLRDEMKKHKFDCNIIAKIESQKGVDNLDEILDSCYGIMVARGDLGIELPIEQITHIQKQMIKKCRDKGKPVIVATQMLQSMVENARPTRAEAADVANAVYDETDCVMLSGETASGKFPVKTVTMMNKILKYNESKKHVMPFEPHSHDQTHLICSAAMSILKEHHAVKVDKILVFTESGRTARVLASYRPNVPVLAVSDSQKTVNILSMSYGIASFYAPLEAGEYSYPDKIIEYLKEAEVLHKDRTILIIHGKRWKEEGGTNALVVVKL